MRRAVCDWGLIGAALSLCRVCWNDRRVKPMSFPFAVLSNDGWYRGSHCTSCSGCFRRLWTFPGTGTPSLARQGAVDRQTFLSRHASHFLPMRNQQPRSWQLDIRDPHHQSPKGETFLIRPVTAIRRLCDVEPGGLWSLGSHAEASTMRAWISGRVARDWRRKPQKDMNRNAVPATW